MDISLLTYEEWVPFFFDRPIKDADEYFPDVFCPDAETWDYARPECLIRYLTRLCLNFAETVAPFSLQQINQSLWAIFLNFEIPRCLYDRDIDQHLRVQCLRSMVKPFADYVDGHPVEVMENCFYMWWDFVLSPSTSDVFLSGDKNAERDEEVLLQAAFESLREILALNDERCKSYALHGLGHLRHPGVREVVQAYIDKYGHDFTPEGIRWLEQCRDGVVM